MWQRLKDSDEPLFALDHRDRIVFWNRACERELGITAAEAMGKRCYDVLRGEDIHGNLYCYPNCPIMHQSRSNPPRPPRDFHLSIRRPRGDERTLRVKTIPGASDGSIAHIVHEQTPHDERRDTAARVAGLTSREREVLQDLAAGHSTDVIATRRSISTTTVRNHIQSILQKLDVHSRFAAVAVFYKSGAD